MKKHFYLLAGIACLLLHHAPTLAGDVITYPLASCYTSSGYYQVKANGVDVPVARYEPQGKAEYYFAHVSASGANTFEIEGYQTINTYTIRPSSYGITGTINGTKLQFTVGQSRYLEIQINQRTILYLLIDPIEENVPAPSGTGIYNITASPYNADNTGTAEVTSTIQQAIDDASANGGGTVYVPTGIYQTGSLSLRDNVEIYLQGGSVLSATTNKASYFNTNPKHIIKADDVSNVKVYGRGSIYCRGVELNDYQPTDAAGTFRIGPIQLKNANNATIEGVLFVESSAWTLTITNNSRNVQAENIKILNEMQWGWNDGINVIGSHDISVQHCFVSTADDAACVKTQNFPKANPGDPVYNVTYDDMVVKSGISSGFKVGMQAEDDIYDVYAKNFDVLDCERAFNLDHWYGDGHFHDIHFVDWVVDKMTGTSQSIRRGTYIDSPFRMEIYQQSSSTYEVGVGSISDIEITRVKFNDLGANDAYFWGEDAANGIDGVRITDLYYGDSLILSSPEGPIQNKGFATNISYNGGPGISFESSLIGAEFRAGDSVTVKVNTDTPGAVSSIDLYVNDTFVRSEGGAPYLWNENGQNSDSLLQNLTRGAYTLKAIAFDSEGASFEITTVLTVTAPNAAPPTVSFKSLLPGTELEAGDDLVVIVDASDSSGAIAKIDLYINDNFIRAEGGAPYAWNEGGQDPLLKNLAAGVYTLRAVATDDQGATAEVRATITVTGLNIAPTVSFESPVPGTVLEEGDDLVVIVDASDSDGTIAQIDLYINDTYVRAEGGAPYAWNENGQGKDSLLQNLAVGTYTLRAVAIDNQGATAEVSTTVAVVTSTLALPGKVEAEAFAEQGGSLEVLPSGDTDGTNALSFMSKGAYVTYPVTIAQAGTYTFTYRVQPFPKKAKFRLQLGDETLHKIKVKKAKKNPVGWQEVTATAELPAGEHTLRIISKKERVSINWWRAELSTNARIATGSPKPKEEFADENAPALVLYPNPSQGSIQVIVPGVENAQVRVYDFQGRMVLRRTIDGGSSNLNLAELPNGLYLIRLKADGRDFQRRIILEK